MYCALPRIFQRRMQLSEQMYIQIAAKPFRTACASLDRWRLARFPAIFNLLASFRIYIRGQSNYVFLLVSPPSPSRD